MKLKRFIAFIKNFIKRIAATKNGSIIRISKNTCDNKLYNEYGFNEQGLDIDNKDIEFYKKELQEIYNRQKVWQLNVKYDIKIYTSRRTLETILILALRHNYGSEFLKYLEQRSLCNYANTIFQEKLLNWSSKRFYEICNCKQYMNNIVHPYQSSYNEEKNNQLRACINKLIKEFKISIGLDGIDKTYVKDNTINFGKAA